MGVIGISVRNKIATNTTPDEIIVCGNSDYSVEFDFDAEWSASASKIARFVYFIGNNRYFKDSEPFKGNTVSVPVLSNIDQVLVGVYTADMSTTTPARVLCSRSIRCGGAVEHITPAEKAGLQAQIGDLEQLETNDRADLVEAINEVLGRASGELDPAIVEKAVQDYLEANPPTDGVSFEVDKTLTLVDGILGVNTTNDMEQDNTLPMTSAGVFATVGNIEALLKTI
jgi:hypothetical protein